MAKYCKKFFYPEQYGLVCAFNKLDPQFGNCSNQQHCVFQLKLEPESYAILNNLRIIKEQNAKILYELTGKKTK